MNIICNYSELVPCLHKGTCCTCPIYVDVSSYAREDIIKGWDEPYNETYVGEKNEF